jgi:hypothetical protein
MTDRQALKTVCVLNNVTFAWDDMDPAVQELDALLPELRYVGGVNHVNVPIRREGDGGPGS